MPPNPLALVVNALINTFGPLLSYALPLLAVAIMGLLAAIYAVNAILGLFGFKLGASEKFREKLRRKLKLDKAVGFPFKLSRTRSKTSIKEDAKSPWTNPAQWSQVNQDMAFDAEQLEGDLDYFTGAGFDDKRTEPFDEAEMIERADSVSSYWARYFPHLGRIDGIISSHLSNTDMKWLYFHAATLNAMKHQALSENAQDWAKQYGDGQASGPVQFVA